MAFRALQTTRNLHRTLEIRYFSYWSGSSISYSNAVGNVPEVITRRTFSCLYNGHNRLPYAQGNNMSLRSTMVADLPIFLREMRGLSTQAKAPALGQKMGAMKIPMLSPGIIYEPYAPREPIPFWRRWFTKSGWKRTKEDILLEMKSAYAIAKMRKSGYSKKKFYLEALDLYKEINTLLVLGDKQALRKVVTERMYSVLKNEIKQRESQWSDVYWELIEPVVKIRTLRARMIGVDRDDLSKVFVQLTLEFLTKQRFEAYDSKGAVVAGDIDKEVLVREIWVFEKSQFHPGAYWRLCGRIPVKPGHR